MIEYENLKKYNQPFFEEYQQKFKNVLENGWFILGKEVNAFETEFAEYCTSKYSVGVANGLDALIIALKVFNFPAGSEVIVPSNTYIATILAILNCNLKPVLVEPDIVTYNIDPTLIENSITRKTVAVMVVHLYGKCCEMDKIQNICLSNGLKLIEDCAQSHGAKFKNQKTGTFGEFGAFSFYPSKNLGALGDAGSLNMNDESLYNMVKKYRNYGSEKKYYNDVVGMNSRLDEVQAAFLRIKLKYLDKINDHKRSLAFVYNSLLKNDFIKPSLNENFYDVFHIYNIRHPKRDQLKDYLLNNGVQTEIHYPVPPHKQVAMRTLLNEKQSFPIAEEIHATTLSLPISFFHQELDIVKVVEVINKF
jgi:dTDP-4-amino-4,6-dideoxygalactose transaminase